MTNNYFQHLKGYYMTFTARKLFPAILFISFLCLIPSFLSAKDIAGLQEKAVIRDRADDIIATGTIDYLKSFDSQKLKVWVFFTDKGIFNSAQFREAAESVRLTDHAAARRAKTDKTDPVFADLPLDKGHLDEIGALGAVLKRQSKWLNAASFEVTEEQINRIAGLPFVHKITPVAKFHSDYNLTEEDLGDIDNFEMPEIQKSTKDILDYGQSFTQNQQIRADEVHQLGYNGAGVIVAMLDTGARKTHQAFAQHYIDGRVLAEYDFINDDGNVQNEGGDLFSQHNHGTYTWSTLGGFKEGSVVGPAYGASFIIAKTEDVAGETQVEEDNWIAALEWADSIGAEVISSSLAYSDWYDYEDYDGNTAPITLAANTAAGLGIVVCNAMGNYGPGSGTLAAPADAFDILSCGAVDASGALASFSSRGPTADGRIKPEVCAMGYATYCALGESDVFFGTKNGTSLSTPLVGGAAAVLIQARPGLTPQQIRLALMETADNAASPNNSFGWGIIDLLAAISWGADFEADSRIGQVGQSILFADISPIPATAWKWYFGDGDSSDVQDPTHIYNDLGAYDVTLITQTADGELSKSFENYINVIADTISLEIDSVYAGQNITISINLTNSQELKEIVIPISYSGGFDLVYASLLPGTRTNYFTTVQVTGFTPETKKLAVRLVSDPADILPMLLPGSGEIARLTFKTDSTALSGQAIALDTAAIPLLSLKVKNPDIEYPPAYNAGEVTMRYIRRGDADGDDDVDILDMVYLVNFKFKGGPAPLTIQSGDADSSLNIDILDIVYLVNYKFKGGPAPQQP